MRNRFWMALSLGAFLALLLGLIYWWGTPRLLEVSPPDGATGVPAGAKVRLTFSRPMDANSIQDRLVFEPAIHGTFTWQNATLIFTPERPWSSGGKVRVELQAGGRASGLFSQPLKEGESWSFTIGQPRLAYLFPADASADIYVMDMLTKESTRLTNSAAGVQDFDFNSNGTAVYYSVRNSQGDSYIYRLNLASSDQDDVESEPEDISPLLVAECRRATCRSPVVSPAEDYLAYERTASPESDAPNYPQVWYQSLDFSQTSDPETLSQANPALASDPLHQTLYPAWSSDGLLAFYNTNENAFVFLNPANGDRTYFPNQTGQKGSWHPNGSAYIAPEIFFVEDDLGDPVAYSHLILFDLRDSAIRDFTQVDGLEDTSPAFSPKGLYLVFARKFLDADRWTPGRQLWVMRASDGEAQPLTNDPYYNHYNFAWSPAGDELVYLRFNQTVLKQPPELWLIDPVSTRATRLVVGGYAPQWIP